MKKLLILITLILYSNSLGVAYTITQQESIKLNDIKTILQKSINNNDQKLKEIINQLNIIKSKYSNNFKAEYLIDYLINVLGDNIQEINSESIFILGNHNQKGNRYIVSKQGIIAGPYNDALDFSEGIVAVEQLDLNRYFLDGTGNSLSGPYTQIKSNFKDGYAVIKKINGNYCYINKEFKQVSGEYRNIMGFAGGYARVQKNDNKRYFINNYFEEIIGPYEVAYDVMNGITVVQKSDNRWYALYMDSLATKNIN